MSELLSTIKKPMIPVGIIKKQGKIIKLDMSLQEEAEKKISVRKQKFILFLKNHSEIESKESIERENEIPNLSFGKANN